MMAETFVRQPLFAFRLLRRQETWYNERKVSERMKSMIKRCNHDCDFSCQQSKKQKVRVIGDTGVFTLLVSAQVRSGNGK